jgi:hypothetical protein
VEKYAPGLRIQKLDAVSFGDGKALCYLVHSYRPDLIDVADVEKVSHRKATIKLS